MAIVNNSLSMNAVNLQKAKSLPLVIKNNLGDIKKQQTTKKIVKAYDMRKMLKDADEQGVDPNEIVQDLLDKGYDIEPNTGSDIEPNAGSRFGAIQDDKNIFGIPKIPRFNNLQDVSVREGATPAQVLGGFATNLGKSALNLGSDVTNFVLDPIDSAKALLKIGGGALVNTYETATGDEVGGKAKEYGDIASQARQYFKDRYGSIEGFSKSAYQDPVGVFSDIVSLVGGGGSVLKGVSKVAPKVKLLQKVGDIGTDLQRVGRLDPANKIIEGMQYTGKKGVNLVKSGVKSAVNKGVDFVQDTKLGLTKEEVKGIQNNPYQSEYWDGTKQVIEQQGVPADMNTLTLAPNEALKNTIQEAIASYEKVHSDSGPLYQEIEKLNNITDLRKAQKPIIDELYNKERIKVNTDGTLDFSSSRFEGSPNLQTQIQKAYDVATSTPGVDVKGFLNKRKSLDIQAKWEGKPTDATSVVKMIRSKVDAVGKEDIPGLKETDNLWSKQLKELNEMKSKLVYEAGPKKGQYRDNITQIVKTLGKENRHQMLQRLEEIVPGLQQRVDAIQNIPKLAKAYTNLGKSSKLVEGAGAIVGSTVGGQIGGIPGNIVGGLVGWGVSKYLESKMGKIRKGALDGVLSTMTPEAQAKLADIDAKLIARQTLSAEDLRIMDSIRARLQTEQSKLQLTNALPAPKATVIPGEGLPQVKQPIAPVPRTRQVLETGMENVKQPTTVQPGKSLPTKTEAPLAQSTTKETQKLPVAKKTPLVKATDSKNISPKVKKPLIKSQVVSKVDDALLTAGKMEEKYIPGQDISDFTYDRYKKAVLSELPSADERDIKRMYQTLVDDGNIKSTELPQKAKSLESDLTSSIKKAKAEGKTFEDYISGLEKDKKVLYHGTSVEIKKAIEENGFSNKIGNDVKHGDAVYLTDNYDDANSFGFERMTMRGDRKPTDVVKVYAPEQRIYKYDGEPTATEIAELKNKGYDGVSFVAEDTYDADGFLSQPGRSEIVVRNKGIVKTKKQLRTERDKLDQPTTSAIGKPINSDLATEAKKTPLVKATELPMKVDEGLVTEARKYKSADEFVDSLPVGGKEGRKLGRGEGYYLATRNKPLSTNNEEISKRFGGVLPNEVKLYRGVKGSNITYGVVPGDYLTTNKSYANNFGELQEYTINTNDLSFGKGNNDYIYIGGVDKTESRLRKIREEANQPTTPALGKTTTELPQKAKSLDTPVKKELSDKGGVLTVKPNNQLKFNQGDSYEPVRLVVNDKDAMVARYGALRNKDMQSLGGKAKLTNNEKMEMQDILRKLEIDDATATKRHQFLKNEAKKVRSSSEQVLHEISDDFRKAKSLEPSDLTKEAKKYKSAEEFVSGSRPSSKNVKVDSVETTPKFSFVRLKGGKNYKEIIHSVDFETNPGGQHYSKYEYPNYFAHSRIDEVSDSTRVLEIQSDLMQSGKYLDRSDTPIRLSELSNEVVNANGTNYRIRGIEKKGNDYLIDIIKDDGVSEGKIIELSKLKQEIKKPIEDIINTTEEGFSKSVQGKLKKQEEDRYEKIVRKTIVDADTKYVDFPTGETASKIQQYKTIGNKEKSVMSFYDDKIGKYLNSLGAEKYTDIDGNSRYRIKDKSQLSKIREQKK